MVQNLVVFIPSQARLSMRAADSRYSGSEHVDEVDALSRCFAVFRPSERRFVSQFFDNESKMRLLRNAITRYLERVSASDRAERYRVHVIGTWLRDNAPDHFLGSLGELGVELDSEVLGEFQRSLSSAVAKSAVAG
jgi:hypothetical protein